MRSWIPMMALPGNNPYRTIWGRVIEECSANWIAYSCFKGREAQLVQKLITTQAAEYLGYAGLQRPVPFPLLLTEPGSLDPQEQADTRRSLRAYFQETFSFRGQWYSEPPHFLKHEWRRWVEAWRHAMERLYLGRWDWDDVFHFLRDERVPLLPWLWGWGSWASPFVASKEPHLAVAAANIQLWKRYKRWEAPRDPEYVIYLEEWALYLLAVGVGAI